MSWELEKKINLPSLIAIVTTMIAAVGWFYRLEYRVISVEARTHELQKMIDRISVTSQQMATIIAVQQEMLQEHRRQIDELRRKEGI